ncbi:hypothetical protein PQJ75_00980 [Rhodoplanes sp. TEM]|uniref:HNH endonuclease n=1 Tax=Rhodoplanes tepidamans TaxID=200616 RepID=A0ABT5J5B3_RHOTP|nr:MULTISPECIES: hypothetical protein [Rhodoplanes]MDC7784827.1 hypothetical protein [Rhodoplanes tepidamans]MDC7982294.1 hypothetical protein [Rhodoplanes sp. TEM]MDQ0356302.1 hypothetical protein [Rhodoplanes tepidamans]
MATRKHISLKTKLAAALLTLRRVDENGVLVPIIPHEHAKLMSAEQIISLFQWDHYPIPHALGGPDEPWNLQPELIRPHRVKTATQDVPTIAKTKRLSAEQEEFRRRVLERPCGQPRERKGRWPSRPFRRKS